MFGSDVLEVVVGVVFLFLFASLIATALRELIEARLKTRSRELYDGIAELVGGRTLADGAPNPAVTAFYQHPVIAALYKGAHVGPVQGSLVHRLWKSPDTLPSYIPAAHFATAMLDMVRSGALSARGSTGGEQFQVRSLHSLIETANAIDNEKVKTAVLALITGAGTSVADVQKRFEAWYDGTMDRVSGWYKRNTQVLLFWIGLLAAVLCNIDSIHVAARLSGDRVLRQTIVAQAEALARQPAGPAGVPAGVQGLGFADLDERLRSMKYPIGWWPPQLQDCDKAGKCQQKTGAEFVVGIFAMVFGWLITALAVTLGAPFWFDILNKVMVIRSTVKPHEKSPEEESEDHQRGRRPPPAPPAAAPAQVSGAPPPPSPPGGAPEEVAASTAAAVAVATTMLARAPVEPQAWNSGDPQEGLA